MRYEYVKEGLEIKDKTENEKINELLMNIIKTKKDLDNARNNYEYAEGELIDYYLYQMKANQSKLNYLIKIAKEKSIIIDRATQIELRNINDYNVV